MSLSMIEPPALHLKRLYHAVHDANDEIDVSASFLVGMKSCLGVVQQSGTGVEDVDGTALDTDLYMAHIVPHVRSILNAYYLLISTSFDIKRLHPFVTGADSGSLHPSELAPELRAYIREPSAVNRDSTIKVPTRIFATRQRPPAAIISQESIGTIHSNPVTFYGRNGSDPTPFQIGPPHRRPSHARPHNANHEIDSSDTPLASVHATARGGYIEVLVLDVRVAIVSVATVVDGCGMYNGLNDDDTNTAAFGASTSIAKAGANTDVPALTNTRGRPRLVVSDSIVADAQKRQAMDPVLSDIGGG
ncbi:hypothetical protein FS837_001372 [Tulasnella sp. UAMH 9824]|nr:hypothetical protein FS837_001372 [Tulasnella sp. UAMH 9824]